MSFIKTRTNKITGIKYYAKVEKVKREDGTWGLKQLESYGTTDPRGTKEEPMETNRLTEQLEPIKVETKVEGSYYARETLVSTPSSDQRNKVEDDIRSLIEQPKKPGSIWDSTIKKLKKHYGDQK